jgi:predicted GNAT superfamily acetyltransferase
MRDALNQGLPSDRFQVDWWLNSQRVNRRLGRKARRPLDLAHYLAADIPVVNPTTLDANRLPVPGSASLDSLGAERPLLLLEIPADFQALRRADPQLGLAWRMQSRELFENLFQGGYLATDFVHLEGSSPRSFYVFSHGESQIYGVYSSPKPAED